MSENQKIIDRIIRARIRAMGYANGVSEEVIRYLNATTPEIKRTILEAFIEFGPRIVGRLRLVETRIAKIRQRAWGKLSIAALDALIQLMSLQGKVLGEAYGQELSEPKKTTISDALAASLIVGLTPKEWLAKLQADDLRRYISQLRIGVMAGEDPKKILARLVGPLASPGRVVANNLRMFVETATSVAVSTAQRLVLQANGNRLAIQYEEWVSILDDRTTAGCIDLNGDRFEVGKGPQPGYHPYCRSERVPVAEGGGDYNVSSYAEWIKTQPARFQKYAGSPFKVADLRPLTINQMLESS
jgi:hypothetical protein